MRVGHPNHQCPVFGAHLSSHTTEKWHTKDIKKLTGCPYNEVISMLI
jgi:hypothetical protein